MVIGKCIICITWEELISYIYMALLHFFLLLFHPGLLVDASVRKFVSML